MNSVNAFETRKRNAISIVFLGVMGSEFGSEFEAYKLPGHSNDASALPATNADYSVVRHTCHALNYILLQPPSARLPAYSPIRRCAVDLVGRGFSVWQPYLGTCLLLLYIIVMRNTKLTSFETILSIYSYLQSNVSKILAHNYVCIFS